MSSNLSDRDVALSLGKIYSNSSISAFQNLNDRTLCVVGTSFKGKAFVPTNVTDVETIGDFEVINSLENVLGPESENNYTHLYDTLHYNIESQCYDSLKIWLDNGGDQATFIKVLGIGSGEKTSAGTYKNAGFNLENNISRNSADNLTKTNNPNAVQPSNVEGNISFVLQQQTTSGNLDYDYLDDLGLDENQNNYFITHTIMSSQGVLPSLFNDNFQNALRPLGPAVYTDQVNETDTDSMQIDFLGLNPQTVDTLDARINDTEFSKNQKRFADNTAYRTPNDFRDYFLEKGHICYKRHDGIALLKSQASTRILTSVKYADLNDESLPNYNSFEQKYQVAKTPWVTSQPINRSNLVNNRQTIYENVVDLFRFHSLDDGEVGNRFRVKINPLTRGDIEENIYATFDVYVFEYDVRDNTFDQVLCAEDIDLNPDSPRYISRVFGDENTYYNVEDKKVVTELKYETRNSFLRVEVHPDVEDKKINCDLIPSGFRAYPYIKLNSACFSGSTFDFTKIFDMPVHYYPYYKLDKTINNETLVNHWGSIFDPNWNLEVESVGKYISPHYFHTKYFMSDLNIESLNVWHQDDQYLNSFFHLEKIHYTGRIEDLSFEALKYSRKANVVANRNYLNLSSEETWNNNDKTLVASLENKLSFDFFTYGGFDGVDIRDLDKLYLNNKALQRETRGEDSSLDINKNPTLFAYKSALNLVKDKILNVDYLVTPGISNEILTEHIVDICEDDKNIISFLDVSGYNSIMNFDHIFVADIVSNYPTNKNQKQVKQYTETDDNGVIFNVDLFDKKYRETVDLLKSSFINSKYIMHLLGSLECDNITKGQKLLDPVNYIIKRLALDDTNITDSVSLETLNEYSINVLQDNLDVNSETWEKDSEIFRDSFLNVLHKDNLGNTTLYSKVTSYEVRNSVFSLFNIINTLLKVKKEIRITLTTENLVSSDQPMLFIQNSSLQNVYTKLEIHLNLLLNNLVNNGIIANYNLNIPNNLDDAAILDAQNYIIRGSVAIQFNENDDFFVDLNLSDIINQISLLSNAIGSEILVPTF